jgi:hypothetical protein
MKTLLFSLAVVGALAARALALAPDTEQFLQTLGFAADSPDVAAVAADSVNGVTLDSLAADHDKNGVKRFIATRAFYKKYKTDASTPFPDGNLYDISYLTSDEQNFIGNRLADSFDSVVPKKRRAA